MHWQDEACIVSESRHTPMIIISELYALLQRNKIHLSSILVHVLSGSTAPTGTPEYHLLNDLLQSAPRLMEAFSKHAATSHYMSVQAEEACKQELQSLALKDSGWHFSALHARADQIKNFTMEGMATQAATKAPNLWRFLTILTHANPRIVDQNLGGSRAAMAESRDAEDTYMADVDGLEDENLIGRSSEPTEGNAERKRASEHTIEKRQESVRFVVSKNDIHVSDKLMKACFIETACNSGNTYAHYQPEMQRTCEHHWHLLTRS